MSITVDLKIGDTILTGKFKNKKVVVKKFGTDKNGQPTVNDKPLLHFRIQKLMPKKGSMKHIARINSEFVKLSSNWEDFSRTRQLKYLQQHPKSRRKYTADFIDPKKDTKEKYLVGMSGWVKSEKEHPKLAMTMKNFMYQYLPDKFYKSLYDEDLTGPVPEELYDDLVDKYDLREYLDEESGDSPEEDLAVIDEKSETVVQRKMGGGYLRIRVATGIYNEKRMIITASERYGLAEVKDKDGNVKRKIPYGSENVELILGI